MQDIKTIIKIANNIRQALMKLQDERHLEILNRLAKFVGQFRELGAESKKLGMSLTHNWRMAAGLCCSRTNRLLGDISYSVSQIKQLTGEPHKELPKLSLLVEELNQLQQEFDDMEFEKEGNSISVVTEPVTLEGVYLGPFRIELELNRLSKLCTGSPYHCIALEPNPAATAEEVTHPHVSNDQLCEGDGSAAIRTSLEQGRIYDFFTMIRSILNTYNPDSPYVSLYDWHGEPCYDCGYTMSSENAYYCEYCENNFCSECSTYCYHCDQTVCLGCARQCSDCGDYICVNCVTECTGCGSLFCISCVEDGLCSNCKEKLETEENEEQNTTDKQNENKIQPETSDTAVKLAS